MKILLIEPSYKAKYPPLGLMKISTYHKNQGDDVTFFKGTSAKIRDQHWDLIYVTSLFTYQWKGTIETIKFYQRGIQKGKMNIKVGGIMASLLQDEVEKETGITPHFGVWADVDRMTPDYSLFGNTQYYSNNASFGYTTRGCPNHCQFCAVHKLEPVYEDYIPLEGQVNKGKKDLILLDNNVLASSKLSLIINDIKDKGFVKGAKLGKAARYVDFNQGVDARLLSEEKMNLLSELPIKPLRLAFDDIKLEELYTEKIRLAHKYGVKHLSNYVLFNFKDTAEDLYRRLQINIELNEQLGLDIFSFPMKYVPLNALDRKYVGANWTKKQLRGIQCILHATHGVVGPKRSFFEAAWGDNLGKFLHIIEQPEETIFDRNKIANYEPQTSSNQSTIKKTQQSLFDFPLIFTRDKP
jgi:hypothetical protein